MEDWSDAHSRNPKKVDQKSNTWRQAVVQKKRVMWKTVKSGKKPNLYGLTSSFCAPKDKAGLAIHHYVHKCDYSLLKYPEYLVLSASRRFEV